MGLKRRPGLLSTGRPFKRMLLIGTKALGFAVKRRPKRYRRVFGDLGFQGTAGVATRMFLPSLVSRCPYGKP